eukprot:2000601-Rhodomonas_salina.1
MCSETAVSHFGSHVSISSSTWTPLSDRPGPRNTHFSQTHSTRHRSSATCPRNAVSSSRVLISQSSGAQTRGTDQVEAAEERRSEAAVDREARVRVELAGLRVGGCDDGAARVELAY